MFVFRPISDWDYGNARPNSSCEIAFSFAAVASAVVASAVVASGLMPTGPEWQTP
jgi:hypothetical protein